MKPTAVNSNVVFAYNYDILDTYKIDEVQEKIKTTFSQSGDLVTASIPNQVKVITSREKNLQVAAQGPALIITDTNYIESNLWTNTDFLLVAFAVKDLFSNVGLKQYGFNFQFTVVLEGDMDSMVKIKEKFFKEDVLGEGRQLEFALPSISYEKNGRQYVYVFGVEFNDDYTPKTLNIMASYVRAQSQTLADAESFIALYKEVYEEAYDFIKEQL